MGRMHVATLSAVVAVAAIVVCGACGELLSIQPDDAPDAGDGTMTLPDGAVVPRDAAAGGDSGAATDAAMDGSACVKTNPCQGNVSLTNHFDTIAAPFIVSDGGPAPALDTSDFISPPSSLRVTTGFTKASDPPSASALTVTTSAGARVCAEVCMKVDVTGTGFGGSAGDTVTIFRLDNVESTPAVAFGVQVAANDGLLLTVSSTEDMPVAIPRGRWVFMTVQIDYGGASPSYTVVIDGTANKKGFVPLTNMGGHVTTSIGVLGSGAHPEVSVTYDDFRILTVL